MINCLTSAAVPPARRAAPRRITPRRAAPDCLFTNRKYENVRNRARRTAREEAGWEMERERSWFARERARINAPRGKGDVSHLSLPPACLSISLSLSLSSCHVAGNIVGYYEFAVFRGGRIETGIVNYSMIIAGQIVGVAPLAITSSWTTDTPPSRWRIVFLSVPGMTQS